LKKIMTYGDGEEIEVATCPCCKREVKRAEMKHIYYCRSISKGQVCLDCYDRLRRRSRDEF
jgi:hypothetical protein